MKLPSVDDIMSAIKCVSPVLRFFKRRISAVDLVTDGRRFAVQKSGIIDKVWLELSGKYWVISLAVADKICFGSEIEARNAYITYKAEKKANAALPVPSLSLKVVAGL